MTSLIAEPPSDDAEQRRMAKAVLYLLHRVSKPYELAKAPFAEAICRATGIANPASALHYVVEDALGGDDNRRTMLRDVLDLDFSKCESAGQAARRMHVSRRHFQRFRAEAVATVAYHLRKLLGSRCEDDDAAGGAGNPLQNLADLAAKVEPATAATIHSLTGSGVSETLQLVRLRAAVDQGSYIGNDAYEQHPGLPEGVIAQFVGFSNEMYGRPTPESVDRPAPPATRYGPSIRFELEYLAFLRARHRGFALEMRTVAANLHRLAGDRGGALTLALQCQADASLRTGNLAEALAQLDLAGRLTFSRNDLRQFAATTMLQSKMALHEGQAQRAEDLANGAYAVLNRKHRDAYACEALVSQARWLSGTAWRPSPGAADLPQTSWDRTVIDIEHARHLAREGRLDRARRLAERSHRHAANAGFEGLAARAAGVLYGAAMALAESDAAQRWRADAIERLLRTRDRLLAVRLLAAPEPCFNPDAHLVDALHRRLCIMIPQMLGDGERQRKSVRVLLAGCVGVLGGGHDIAGARASMKRVNESDSALAHYGRNAAPEVLELLSLTGSALAGTADGRGVGERAAELAAMVAETACAGSPRSFAISTQGAASR